MFIETEATQDARTIRFLPGQRVLPSGTLVAEDADAAARSPLAQALLEIAGVARVVLGTDYLDVTLAADAEIDWYQARPQVLARIMDHFVSGQPTVLAGAEAAEAEVSEADAEIIQQIEELLETRIRPAIAANDGTVELKRFHDGIAELAISPSLVSFLGPIGNMMRHYIPEVASVREYRDLEATPGLATREGRAVQRLLDEEINPAVAAHGGYISLVDVKEDVVYIRLEGGCQGCGMADVTLKQGVEAAIMRELPHIAAVRDTTDHAGGTNPYYQPSRK
ncbi:MAG TPA: NifU family protein [Alphaproteobacteria bacterium]|nr:NifU family protein [Alphaproteobacteria bacterium]